MTQHSAILHTTGGHGTTTRWVLCLLVLCLCLPAQAQKKRTRGDEKVYLDHADRMIHDQYAMPGVTILKGGVKFHNQDMRLQCDSAYWNEERNTYEAFGHVFARRADGTTLNSDYAYYDGRTEMFQARRRVVLTQPGRSLKTDSLDYNMRTEYGHYWGEGGGTLVFGQNKVTSKRGEFYNDSHEAHFSDHVVMTSPKYVIETNNLRYNTETEEAHITGPSVIKGRNGEVVHTNNGYYYSKTDRMELTGRSTITSKERDVEGDNIKYNSKTGESEGHGRVKIVDKQNDRVITGENLYYNEKASVGWGNGNVVYVDRRKKHQLFCEFVDYTDSVAVAHGKALLKDYSQGSDTLFVHADTVRMRAWHLNTDSVYRKIYGYNNVRAYRTDIQAVCDSLVGNSADSTLTMYQGPVVWNDNRQLLGDSIKVYMNDSTVRQAYVYGHALSIELMQDGEHYHQLASQEMRAFFDDGKLRRNEAIGNVLAIYYPLDDKDSTIILMNYIETDTMRMFLTPERKLEKIWASKSKGTAYPLTQIPPGKDRLAGFAWYDDIRPRDKYDLFRHASRLGSRRE